jgi:hypothetical protein
MAYKSGLQILKVYFKPNLIRNIKKSMGPLFLGKIPEYFLFSVFPDLNALCVRTVPGKYHIPDNVGASLRQISFQEYSTLPNV